MAITPKTEKKPLTNWFPLPEKGDLFMSWWVEWKVMEINDPTAWFCKILYKKKEATIWFYKLYENIDQKKWWYQKIEEKKVTKKVAKKIKSKNKTKYDWIAMKQEYFESDFIDVAPFLKNNYSINTGDNGNALEKSKWWWDEKKKIQEELQREAMKTFKSNMKKKWDDVFDKLEQAHVKWLDNLAEMILDQWEVWEKRKAYNIRDKETWELIDQRIETDQIIKPILWHFDIINILKHVKLEKWEPTEIVNDWLQAKRWLEDMKEQKRNIKT